ncbi:MAG: TrkH family potassium uptake protein [Deltaproteobacteria bacterium]|nr:MAG: TrkH family potassium uptake protein [Deltaproteobacteria bacterium]
MPTEERVRALSFAVRPRVVGRYLGDLTLAVGLLTVVPAGVALASSELRATFALATAAAALVGLGLLLRRLRASEEVQRNEAMVIVAAIFLLVPVAMVGPLMVAGDLGFLDAFFEAVSGVTTTGLTTVAPLEGRSRSFLFTRAWMQWYGGLGIVALAAALMTGPGIATRRLGLVGAEGELAPESFRGHARQMLVTYLQITALGVVALVLVGATSFDALTHALSGVSTGGFSSHDASLPGLGGWPIQAVATLLGLCGAVSLPLYARARRQGIRALTQDVELRALLLACGASTLLLGLLLATESGAAPLAALRHASLLAVSAQTTTGFTPIAPAELGPAAKLVVIGSMASGGSLGSTAGGIKLLRVLIAIRLIRWMIRRARLAPHAVAEPRLGGERLESVEIERALVLILLFLAVVGLSWLAFVAYGHDALDALFEVVSATGTVGLSVGLVGASLEPVLRAVLCADMLLGRLEVVALLVALSPATWLGRRAG